MSKYVIPRIDEPVMTPNGTMSLPWYLYLKQGGSGGGGGGGGGSTDNYIPPMLSYQRSDHKLNDMQWLRADTFSWQNGAVYFGAYQHLLADYEDTKLYAWHTRNSGGYNLYTKVRNPEVGTQLYNSDGSVSSYTIKSVRTGTSGESVEYIYVDISEYETDVEFYRQSIYDTRVSETETIAGTTITYYPGNDGHKIVLSDQESNVAAIYNTTGDAWYYILDTTNQRFKLPRRRSRKIIRAGTVNGVWYRLYADGWVEQGGIAVVPANGVAITLPIAMANSTYGCLSTAILENIADGVGLQVYGRAITSFYLRNKNYGSSLQVSATWQVSGLSAIDTSELQGGEKYTYFFVGLFTDDAIKNTAGLNAEMFNDLNAHKVVAFQAPTADNNYTWYRKYADGWVEQGGVASTPDADTNFQITLPVMMSDVNYSIQITDTTGNTNAVIASVYTGTAITTTGFYIRLSHKYYNAGAPTVTYWQVSGMAAQGD